VLGSRAEALASLAIDDGTVRHIARLAHLEVDEAALPELRAQLGAILDYVAQLEELDAESAPDPGDAPPAAAGAREDEVVPGLAQDEALASAPESQAGLFRVPRVLSG
jgi:aspartyl-tRNA(Asn)/glutamyl-tRNA(Gln) amidotransferase subunit C